MQVWIQLRLRVSWIRWVQTGITASRVALLLSAWLIANQSANGTVGVGEGRSVNRSSAPDDPPESYVLAGTGVGDPECAGQPVGTPCPDTDDNVCTVARCDGVGNCVQNSFPTSLAGSPCPDTDGNFCTRAQCDGVGHCDQNLPVSQGAFCPDTDGDACTAAICDGAGNCDQTNPDPNEFGELCLDTDNNECTEARCGLSGCDQSVPSLFGTPCPDTDGNICTKALCLNGFCNQNNVANNGLPCPDTDGNVCTKALCLNAFCNQNNVANNGLACPDTDGNVCTKALCLNAFCNQNNVANNGLPCPDTDGNVCTEALCLNAFCNQNNVANNGLPCPDTDGNVCTKALCLNAFCNQNNVSNNGTPCDDGDDCTVGDTCQSGSCIPGQRIGCRVSTSKKGSLIYFSKIELKWDSVGRLWQDTFLTIVNDYPDDVLVQWYFINGDSPLEAVYVGSQLSMLERAHSGWNWADCTTKLTNNESTYMSAATGNPLGCQPFSILDQANAPFSFLAPRTYPGRPDPEAPAGTRILRGYAIAFAVDEQGHEISWNHLSGSVDIVDYLERSAWEYNGYAFQCLAESIPGLPCGAADGEQLLDGIEGELLLDGVEYDSAFDRLLFDFYAVDSSAFNPTPAGTQPFVKLNTDLTLYPVSVDLRQDNDGPITTKAKFDIWNQNEDGFSGTTRCITCWDQTLLSNYGSPNNFLIGNIHTDKGKARIDGIASTVCDPPGSCCNLATDPDCFPARDHPAIDPECSVGAALLGVADKILFFSGPGALRRQSDAGMTLVGQGTQSAAIKRDIITPPEPLTTGTGH